MSHNPLFAGYMGVPNTAAMELARSQQVGISPYDSPEIRRRENHQANVRIGESKRRLRKVFGGFNHRTGMLNK